MKKVILSTKLLIGEGSFTAKRITKDEAVAWLDSTVVNYCGHESVKIIGLEPSKSREMCSGYDEALAINAKARLERREYTQEEIEEIGVEFTLITKIS